MKSHARLLFLLLVMLAPVSVDQTNPEITTKSNSLSEYVPHGGIIINGNNDFANQAASEGWPGNGSIVNPYVLQDLSITGWNNLSIMNVSCCFVVRNCELVAAAGVFSCVYLDSTSNGHIESCQVGSAYYGVILGPATSGNMVYNNSFDSNGINAWDDGLGNSWDDGVGIGNRWSDYAGSGVYLIGGIAGSVDRYPSKYTGPPLTTTEPTFTTTEPTFMLWLFLSVAVVSIPVFLTIQSKRS